MRKLLLSLMLLFMWAGGSMGQSTANYVYSTATDGSLIDMSSQTTDIFATGTYRDDVASTVFEIGFTFYFMGMPYTDFSINSNGQLRLGATAIGGAQQSPTLGAPLIAPISGDNALMASGKAHYKVTGTAPNRSLIVEWVDLRMHYGSTASAPFCTLQAVLSENGTIEFIYGRMYNTHTSAVLRGIYFSSGTATGQIGQVVTITTTPAYNSSNTSLTTSSFAAGSDMVNLNSTADGARRLFTFTPQSDIPSAPINLSFTGVTSTGMVVNWEDNSTSETFFRLTRATDAAFTQNVVVTAVNSTSTATTGTAYNSTVTGLIPNTTYYFKVTANNEGSAGSAELTGDRTTDPPGNFVSAQTGDWNAGSTWVGGVAPASVDNATIASDHTVTINATGLAINNLTINGTLAYGSTPASFAVNGNLVVNSGGLFNVFQGTTGKTLNVAGNITNNGTIDISVGSTTAGNLTLNGTTVQTVSGAGTFNNGFIRNLTLNNTNTAIPNINWQFNINIAYNLSLTNAKVEMTGYKMTWGHNAAGNTLTVGTGSGFLPGAKYARWWTTAQTGSSINAGSDPTTTTSRYPFINSLGQNRSFWVERSTSSTTGNTAGELAVVYTDGTGMTTGLSIDDGAYTITDRFNGYWTVTAENGYVYVSGTHEPATVAPSAYLALNGNSRLMYASAALPGAHQNGTTTPGAQRSGLTTAELTGGAIYMGINADDVPFLSVASGDYNNAATWNKGIAPVCDNLVTIASDHTVTVNSAGNVAKGVTIASGGTLVVASGDLTVGCTLNNNTLTNNGTLTVNGGTLNINGNLNCVTGSVFNQNGGDINIDGNDAGIAANSVASGVAIVNLNVSALNSVNLTGGTLTIVDPHANTTASLVLRLNGTVNGPVNVTTGHTIRFGDGTSTDPGGNATNGFRVDTWATTTGMPFGNVIVEGPSGTNRFVSSTYQQPVWGNVTVNGGGELRMHLIYINGNLVVNAGGVFTSTTGLQMTNSTFVDGGSVSFSPSSNAQAISGAGTFRNLAASPTANLTSFTINNSNVAGVTLNVPLSLSGTLTLTQGIVNTVTGSKTVNLLTLGTATAAGTLSGGSATAYINGPFARTFPASRTATGTYAPTTLFPVGKDGVYQPIWIDPSTSAGGPVVFTGETFTTNDGTAATGVTNLSSARWEASVLSGGANLTNSFLQIGENNIVTGNQLLESTAADGVYGAIPVSSVFNAGPPPVLRTGSAIPAASLSSYFAYGNLTPCDAPTAQPTNFVSSFMTTTTFTGSFTAASPEPDNYLVVRYASGATVTDPSDFSNYTAGTALGAGTVRYAGPATTFNETGLTAGTTYDYYVYSYNSTGCYGPVYLTTSPLYAEVTTCATAVGTPGTPTASGVQTNQFTANWTASTTSDVEYLLDVATDNSFTNFVAGYNGKNVGTNLSDNVTGLSASTLYYVRVRAVDGDCYSAFSGTLSVWTLCDAVTTFSENFDGVTTPALPVCWAKVGTEGSASTQTSGNFSAPNCLYIYAGSGTYGATVTMPPLSNLGAGTHRLTFKLRANFTVGGVVQVGYMTDPTDPASFVLLQSFTTTSTTVYQDCEVIPGTAPGANQILAFRQPPTPGYSALIDNVVWEQLPSDPILNVVPGNLAFGYVPAGQTSAEQTYDLSGVFLTGFPDDITVTAPAGFEVSLTSGSGFATSVLVPYTSATLPATPIYVRFKPTAPATDYSGDITNAGGGAVTKNVAVSGTSQLIYCSSAATNLTDEWITNVTFAGINNNSGSTGYSNFKAISGTVQKGETYPFSATIFINGSYDEFVTVWIDWNQNGVFEASERTEIGTCNTSGCTVTNNIVVPPDAVLGSTVMRVNLKWNAYSTNPCETFTFGEVEDYTVVVTPGAACPAPSNLTATNLTPTSATLGWTPGGTETLWHVEVGAPGFSPGSGTSLLSDYFTPDNPWLASPLTPETGYEFHVKAYCNGFDTPRIGNFWMAMPESGILDEGQSGGTFDPELQEDGIWYLYDDAPGQPWWNIWWYNDPLDLTRMKKIRVGFWITTFDPGQPGILQYVINWSTPDWVTPPLPLPGFPMPNQEQFIQRSPIKAPMMIPPGTMQWIELLYIVEDFNPEWVSLDVWGDNIIIEMAPMAPPAESPLFEWWQPTMMGGIIVHECLPRDHSSSEWSGPFFFSTPVSCPPPTGLTTISTSTDGAQVQWTSTAGEFEIEYGVAPYTFTETANVTGIFANSHPFTGLDPETTYQYKVKAICGVSDESEWSAMGSFTTDCLPIDLPWCENFDGVTAPAIPVCMTVTNDNNDAYQWATYTTNPYSAPNAMSILYNEFLPSDDWFFSPGLNLEAGVEYQVEFYYRAQSSGFPEALKVMWGSSPAAAGMTGGTIWNNGSITNTAYQLASGVFTPDVTGVYYIGWHAYSDADMWRLYVDDICVDIRRYPVTFNVDITTIDGFDPDVTDIYMAGTFPGATWDTPGSNDDLLMQPGAVTDVYTLTLNLPAGYYEYKYFRVFDEATWNNGEYQGGDNRSIVVDDEVSTCDVFGGTIAWANLQWPGAESITEGGSYDVYGQVHIPLVTNDPSLGYIYILEAWVGISDEDTDPSGWDNWMQATFNGKAGGNDEYVADIAGGLEPGIYYYAYRYRFGQICGSYLYGGYNGGFWDGVDNVSGILTVNPSGPPSYRFVDGAVDDCLDAQDEVEIDGATVETGAIADIRSGGIITATDFEVKDGGTAYLTAQTSITLGVDVLITPGASGFFLAKIDNFTPCSLPLSMIAAEDVIIPEELPVIAKSESFFKVYPNPTTSNFNIELTGAGQASKINVEIYSMMGERVFRNELEGAMLYEFNISAMPRGIYIIRVINGEEMGAVRLIKQ